MSGWVWLLIGLAAYGAVLVVALLLTAGGPALADRVELEHDDRPPWLD